MAEKTRVSRIGIQRPSLTLVQILHNLIHSNWLQQRKSKIGDQY